MEDYCKSSGLLIYVLVLALLFNVLTFFLYIRICIIKWKQRQSLLDPPVVPDNVYYICNETLADDLKQVHSLNTLSAYSTNTLRGSISILAMTMATSFTLMWANIYYNAIIYNYGSDAQEWAILISYSMLILPGLFPSNDLVVRQNGEPLRPWGNVFFCTTVPFGVSAVLHGIGTIMYLFVPTILNLALNWYEGRGMTDVYFFLSWASLILNIFFGLQQLSLWYLGDKLKLRDSSFNDLNLDERHRTALNEIIQSNVMIRKFLFFLSYTIELLAFPMTTFQYLFIELTLITENCGVFTD